MGSVSFLYAFFSPLNPMKISAPWDIVSSFGKEFNSGIIDSRASSFSLSLSCSSFIKIFKFSGFVG